MVQALYFVIVLWAVHPQASVSQAGHALDLSLLVSRANASVTESFWSLHFYLQSFHVFRGFHNFCCCSATMQPLLCPCARGPCPLGCQWDEGRICPKLKMALGGGRGRSQGAAMGLLRSPRCSFCFPYTRPQGREYLVLFFMLFCMFPKSFVKGINTEKSRCA